MSQNSIDFTKKSLWRRYVLEHLDRHCSVKGTIGEWNFSFQLVVDEVSLLLDAKVVGGINIDACITVLSFNKSCQCPSPARMSTYFAEPSELSSLERNLRWVKY